MTVTVARTHDDASQRKAGGVAALYLAFALLAAIPYFLVVVDYPGATTAADKVDLIVDHYPSMYAVYLLTYVLFGIAVGVVALTLGERLRPDAPATIRVATAVGLMWAVALVASGLIFTYGMTTINDLAATDHAGAVNTREQEMVGKPVGTVGTGDAPATAKTVVHLERTTVERTTGFEPATLTLARSWNWSAGSASPH